MSATLACLHKAGVNLLTKSPAVTASPKYRAALTKCFSNLHIHVGAPGVAGGGTG